MSADADVLVIGAGLNGLVAACTLARQGFRVAVLEAHPRRPGGALATEEGTRAGFAHDVAPLVCPLLNTPALSDLELSSVGLRLQTAPFDLCRLSADGSSAAVCRDAELTAVHFGTAQDGERWLELARLHERLGPRLQELLLGPSPSLGALCTLRPRELLQCSRLAALGAEATWRRGFGARAARELMPTLAVQSLPAPQARSDSRWAGYFGYLLAALASTSGFPFPAGGAQGIVNALVTRLERHGGQLLLGSAVHRISVQHGRARGVRLRDGRELTARRGVLVSVPRSRLVSELLMEYAWPARSVRATPRVSPRARLHVDFALRAPVPWLCPVAHQSALVFADVAEASLPRQPSGTEASVPSHGSTFTVTQYGSFDASRAPPHQQAISCHILVARQVAGGWQQHSETFADRLEERLESVAPGFRDRVVARRVHAPQLPRAGETRTLSSRFRHDTPIQGLFIGASDGPPGPGVHGMCGYHAALRAARALG